MASEARRAEIRRQYRVFRTAIDKTQLQMEALARLATGRYWRIENGFDFPTEDERVTLANIFNVSEAEIPTAHEEAKAS